MNSSTSSGGSTVTACSGAASAWPLACHWRTFGPVGVCRHTSSPRCWHSLASAQPRARLAGGWCRVASTWTPSNARKSVSAHTGSRLIWAWRSQPTPCSSGRPWMSSTHGSAPCAISTRSRSSSCRRCLGCAVPPWRRPPLSSPRPCPAPSLPEMMLDGRSTPFPRWMTNGCQTAFLNSSLPGATPSRTRPWSSSTTASWPRCLPRLCSPLTHSLAATRQCGRRWRLPVVSP
mmetsp:Transcript_28962/g.84543  ORF Transcript_28962/g.84543 Transcript_28962/m.84543 type:complete len:232 (+) Transcript_28962:428-1123(+)